MFDIILRYFNINIVTNSTSNLKQIMPQSKVIKHAPKHISGSLFDYFTSVRKYWKKFS